MSENETAVSRADPLRPIVGIENRKAAEVFDIMSDRIRLLLAALPSPPSPGSGGEADVIDTCDRLAARMGGRFEVAPVASPSEQAREAADAAYPSAYDEAERDAYEEGYLAALTHRAQSNAELEGRVATQSPHNTGNIMVAGEEYVPLSAYREAMGGWKASNAEVHRLREVLGACRTQFAKYAKDHRRKAHDMRTERNQAVGRDVIAILNAAANSRQGKADADQRYVDLCDTALAPAVSPADREVGK